MILTVNEIVHMMRVVEMFTIDHTPCGREIFVVEMSTWEGNGFPHPRTGLPVDIKSVDLRVVDKGDDNRYWVGALDNDTFIRVLND